jgi:hypothetical protein
MTDICERRVVRRLERDPSHCLAAFVAEHRARDGKVHITLRLPLRMFEKWKSPIVRRVIATFYPLQSLRDEHPTYSVSWSARGGGPFPEFAGALAGAKLPCDDYFGLILSGHYEPPLGTMGALFDAILGHPIAHGLAQDLLQSIAAHLENASGPAVSMFRARKTPREKAARMNHRTTVPILALPFRNGIIRNWNQLDGRAVIREISTNMPRSSIIPSRLRTATPRRRATTRTAMRRPYDNRNRSITLLAVPLSNARFAASDGCLTRQANQQASHHSIAALPRFVRNCYEPIKRILPSHPLQ